MKKAIFSFWFYYSHSESQKINSLNSKCMGNECHRLYSYFMGFSLQNQRVTSKLYVMEVSSLPPTVAKIPWKECLSLLDLWWLTEHNKKKQKQKNAFSQKHHLEWSDIYAQAVLGQVSVKEVVGQEKGRAFVWGGRKHLFFVFLSFALCFIPYVFHSFPFTLYILLEA